MRRRNFFLIFFLLVSAAGFYLLYRTHSVWAYVQVGDPSPVPADVVPGHWISTPTWRPESIVHFTYAKRFPLFPGSQHRWVWKDEAGRLLARIDYPGPKGGRDPRLLVAEWGGIVPEDQRDPSAKTRILPGLPPSGGWMPSTALPGPANPGSSSIRAPVHLPTGWNRPNWGSSSRTDFSD